MTDDDGLARMLAERERDEDARLAAIEAAVDAQDAAALERLLGCPPEQAKEMFARLRPPDPAKRALWLDRWAAMRRRGGSRWIAIAGGVAAAALVLIALLLPRPSEVAVPNAEAKIISKPASADPAMRSEEGTAAPAPAAEHLRFAGDLFELVLTLDGAWPEGVELRAVWKDDPWPARVRTTEIARRFIVTVEVPESAAAGTGRLFLELGARSIAVDPPIRVVR
jgi:hypothetical protein